jgi:hypothetical protein
MHRVKAKHRHSGRLHREREALRSASKLISATLAFCGLAACSWEPFEALSSLSPAVGAGTLGYSDAVGDAADRILLTNILRAKDLEPLNLSQLSSVSGTVSLAGTLGFTIPFGPSGFASSSKNWGQNSAAPSVTGTTTPTYTVTPLNTQAFTLSILQPVSAAYVLNRQQAGVPLELLLLLFVKEIDFPVLDHTAAVASIQRYINDPDNEASFLAFASIIHSIVTSKAELKAFDIMDPIGPKFSLYSQPSNTNSLSIQNPAPPPRPPPTSADQTGFGLITNANDGQYHVGNVIEAKKAGPNGDQIILNGGELYRVYAGQVALCVSGSILNYITPAVSPPRPKSPEEAAAELGAILRPQGMMEALSTTLQSTGAASPPAGGTKGGTPSTGGAAAASTQALTPALQAGRVSAVVQADGCKYDQIVLQRFEEKDFQSASQFFIRIQWRSVSEVFDYLGAILRYNERHRSTKLVSSAASSPSDDSATVSSCPSTPAAVPPVPATAPPQPLPENLLRPFQFPVCADPNVVEIPKISTLPQSAILFAVYQGFITSLSVRHHDQLYEIADIDPNSPRADYTRVVLSMLSSLVNYSAQPSVSTSTPLRLLPIP